MWELTWVLALLLDTISVPFSKIGYKNVFQTWQFWTLSNPLDRVQTQRILRYATKIEILLHSLVASLDFYFTFRLAAAGTSTLLWIGPWPWRAISATSDQIPECHRLQSEWNHSLIRVILQIKEANFTGILDWVKIDLYDLRLVCYLFENSLQFLANFPS